MIFAPTLTSSAPPHTRPITACCDQFHPKPSFDFAERLRRAENQVVIKISRGKLAGGSENEEEEGGRLRKKTLKGLKNGTKM